MRAIWFTTLARAAESVVGVRMASATCTALGSTDCTTSATTDLATAIDAWDGPGILVIAGNLFEMVAADVVDTRQALDAHPKLTAAVAAFRRCEGRRVICLPGSKDGRLAWDDDAFLPVARELGAERALAVTLRLDTGAGRRTVRVEPGHRFDPRSACVDPRSPADTPLSHHLVTEILPSLGPARATWLAGVERLADASALPRFLASRLVYRRAATARLAQQFFRMALGRDRRRDSWPTDYPGSRPK